MVTVGGPGPEQQREMFMQQFGSQYADLFFITTFNPLYYSNYKPSTPGSAHITPEAYYKTMAQFLSDNTNTNITSDDMTRYIGELMKGNPSWISIKYKDPGKKEEPYIFLDRPSGSTSQFRFGELQAKVPRIKPGERVDYAPIARSVAKEFVAKAKIGQPKVK